MAESATKKSRKQTLRPRIGNVCVRISSQANIFQERTTSKLIY